MRSDETSDRPFADAVFDVVNPAGSAEVLFVCEHASDYIPSCFGDLGLAEADRHSHAVWDPGAEPLARALSLRFDAPLVLGRLSRLVHDCNRPAAAPEACPAQVERIEVPGNRGLTGADRAARAKAVHAPFHAEVVRRLAGPRKALVTVHSFTPRWFDEPRGTEIGLLHDADDRMVLAMLAAAGARFRVVANRPYSAADGVTHTLAAHSAAARASAMIEVRNDLLGSPEHVARAADALAEMLSAALAGQAVTP